MLREYINTTKISIKLIYKIKLSETITLGVIKKEQTSIRVEIKINNFAFLKLIKRKIVNDSLIISKY